MIKKIVFGCALISAVVGLYIYQQHQSYYDVLIMTGATPLALAETVPPDISLTIDGCVKKIYRFDASALRAFSTARIRTREISKEGNFTGAYAYQGIPVFHILEGISPQKPQDAIFNQPLDLMVVFTSGTGKQSVFSYNEIIMVDDRNPVTLAFDCKPVSPTSEVANANYPYNKLQSPLAGLKLICPKEPDTDRYLDDVVRITFVTPKVNDGLLPARRKGERCFSEQIMCLDGGNTMPATLDRVSRCLENKWVRIGHGHGFDDIVSVEGYQLRAFIRRNFSDTSNDDMFLFVACDGYRCLFSGREIFMTDDGAGMMLIDSVNGVNTREGFMLASPADYYIDRAMWGVAYIVRIDGARQLKKEDQI